MTGLNTQPAEGGGLVASPWPRAWPLKLVCAVWAAPNIVVGLALTVLIVLANQFKVRFRFGAGGYDVACYGWLGNWMRRKDWGATTVGLGMHHWFAQDATGWMIADVEVSAECWPFTPRLLIHERRHVTQQLVFGILFYVIYGVSCSYNFIATRSTMEAYNRCVLERDARAHSPGDSDGYPMNVNEEMVIFTGCALFVIAVVATVARCLF